MFVEGTRWLISRTLRYLIHSLGETFFSRIFKKLIFRFQWLYLSLFFIFPTITWISILPYRLVLLPLLSVSLPVVFQSSPVQNSGLLSYWKPKSPHFSYFLLHSDKNAAESLPPVDKMPFPSSSSQNLSLHHKFNIPWKFVLIFIRKKWRTHRILWAFQPPRLYSWLRRIFGRCNRV